MDTKRKGLLAVIAVSIAGALLVIVSVVRLPEQKTVPAAESAAAAEPKFNDGADWSAIDMLKAPDGPKQLIKGDILKLTIESSALSGNPLQNEHAVIPDYINYLDNFYRDPDNKPMPVFFALKIADMAGTGSDNASIAAYRLTVMQKLKNTGLIK
ncbi:MAG: hypothetical protein WCG78_08745 [Candidatus Omnitrophota bacterium]